MHPRTVATLPIIVRSFTGVALGFGIVGISTEDLVAGIAAALIGAVGGLILSTTAWAMIGGALVGGLALGIASILVTGISKTAIYGAFVGAPLGASLASLVGLRIETMMRMRRKQPDPRRTWGCGTGNSTPATRLSRWARLGTTGAR
jgi:hypothetical protein